jgi:hypothetical protein
MTQGARPSSRECSRIGQHLAPGLNSQQLLNLSMGQNTPERKDYIMENVAVTVEG